MAIPAPSDAEREEDQELARSRNVARSAVALLTWHELRLLVRLVEDFPELSQKARAHKIWGKACGLYLKRGGKPR